MTGPKLAGVREDIEAISRQLNLSAELGLIDKAWNAEIGALGGAVRIAAIDRRQLVIEALTSAALQEVSLRRRELVRRMNKHFLKPLIDGITVRMASHG